MAILYGYSHFLLLNSTDKIPSYFLIKYTNNYTKYNNLLSFL